METGLKLKSMHLKIRIGIAGLLHELTGVLISQRQDVQRIKDLTRTR